MYALCKEKRSTLRSAERPKASRLQAGAVVDKAVGRARARAGDKTRLRESNNAARDSRRGGESLKSNEVGSKTSDVRRSHGGTRDAPGGRAGTNPGRGDGRARSENVEGRAIVGVRGTSISAGGGTDSDGIGSRSGRVVGGIGIVVTSSDDKSDTGVDSSVNSRVDGGRVTTTKRHVGNGLPGDALGPGIASDPVDTSNDTRVATGSRRAQNLNTNEVDTLSNTIARAADSASNVGAVAVAISSRLASDSVVAVRCAATKVRVRDVDTSVDNVGSDTGAGSGIVNVLGSATSPVGDATKTPRGDGALGGQSIEFNFTIGFNIGNL